MRLAIVAAPPLALVSIATIGLALRPHRPPPPPTPIQARFVAFDVVIDDSSICERARSLIVRGEVTGGASHVQLAGPIIYTDVTTDARGAFELRVPMDGNVCDLLPKAQHFQFAGDGMTVAYSIEPGW